LKPTSEILERMNKNACEHPNGVYTRLYRYLLREDIYLTAYKNLYANKGAATKGVDEDTADGFGMEYIHTIIEELQNQSYTPKSVRRIYIPKANGKQRPLGIPSFRDKIVQDAIRQILEAIYEPVFSQNSHGFRPRRSCHTALRQVSKHFRSVKWFIEGDIRGCFDNIDHAVLLNVLSERIKDSKFIGLIGKFLKAGYLENWKYHATYSGTPQGGILSPLLANIYLHELDKKVEQIQERFTKPPERAYTKIYCEKLQQLKRLDRQLKATTNPGERQDLMRQIRQLNVERRSLPYKDATDKKLAYVRYADDFLIGISGTKEESEQIKQELKQFLTDQLHLELSEEKTKITHSSDQARFLGYDISVRRNDQCKRKSNGTVQRTLNNSVELLVPLADKIERFMYEREIVRRSQDGRLIPWQRMAMSGLTSLEVVDTYNSQTRGICNYYSLASNFAKLTYFVYLMEYSCLKTLAQKHKTRISAIKRMYKAGPSWGVPYETKTGMHRMMIVKFSDMKKASVMNGDVDKITHKMHYTNVNSFDSRLKLKKCELCGETDDVAHEIHHVNKLRNLKGKEQWERAMIARNRKTLVVCKPCHIKIHHPSSV